MSEAATKPPPVIRTSGHLTADRKNLARAVLSASHLAAQSSKYQARSDCRCEHEMAQRLHAAPQPTPAPPSLSHSPVLSTATENTSQRKRSCYARTDDGRRSVLFYLRSKRVARYPPRGLAFAPTSTTSPPPPPLLLTAPHFQVGT